MAEINDPKQEMLLPTDLMYSIYAIWSNNKDVESVFEVCVIPAQYMDAASDLWDKLRKENEESPLPVGNVDWIPGEF